MYSQHSNESTTRLAAAGLLAVSAGACVGLALSSSPSITSLYAAPTAVHINPVAVRHAAMPPLMAQPRVERTPMGSPYAQYVEPMGQPSMPRREASATTPAAYNVAAPLALLGSIFVAAYLLATRNRQQYAMMATSGDRSPNPVIKVGAMGMSLLAPIFKVEAALQALVLGAIGGVDKAAVAAEVDANVSNNKILIYTYSLSPFSSEAKAMLDASGYPYTEIELGAEWFLLGPEASETRVALANKLPGGASSLPKIFINGECIGGCAELAGLVESGELDIKVKARK